MSRLVHVTASCCALIAALTLPRATEATDNQGGAPESVVWDYLDTQFSKAANDSTYWKRRWNLEIAVKRSDVRLGKPFSRYRLGMPELEAFVASGDLLGSAFLTTVSYPVYTERRLIGTVQLVRADGQWVFSDRHLLGGTVDSLGAAHGERGDSVAAVGIKGVGAYLLITRAGDSETRVYPIGEDRFLSPRSRTDGSVSYRVACELLRPAAAKRLEGYKRREKERQNE